MVGADICLERLTLRLDSDWIVEILSCCKEIAAWRDHGRVFRRALSRAIVTSP